MKCMHNHNDPNCLEKIEGEELYQGLLGSEWYCRSYLLEHNMILIYCEKEGWCRWVDEEEIIHLPKDLEIVQYAIDLF